MEWLEKMWPEKTRDGGLYAPIAHLAPDKCNPKIPQHWSRHGSGCVESGKNRTRDSQTRDSALAEPWNDSTQAHHSGPNWPGRSTRFARPAANWREAWAA